MSWILSAIATNYAIASAKPIPTSWLNLWIDGTNDWSNTFYDVSWEGHNLTKSGTITVTSEAIGNKVVTTSWSGKLVWSVGSAVSWDFTIQSLVNANLSDLTWDFAIIASIWTGVDAPGQNISLLVHSNSNVYFAIWWYEFSIDYTPYFNTNTLITATYTAATNTKKLYFNWVLQWTNTTNLFWWSGNIFKIWEDTWNSSTRKKFSFYDTTIHNRILTTQEMIDLANYYWV